MCARCLTQTADMWRRWSRLGMTMMPSFPSSSVAQMWTPWHVSTESGRWNPDGSVFNTSFLLLSLTHGCTTCNSTQELLLPSECEHMSACMQADICSQACMHDQATSHVVLTGTGGGAAAEHLPGYAGQGPGRRGLQDGLRGVA